MENITNSSISCFKECRRKFYYSYIKKIRPAQTKTPLRIGSMVHEGLDMLAKGGDINDVIMDIGGLYADEKIYSDEQAQQLMFECVTVQTLIEKYAEAWKDQDIEIIESEEVFELPIINPETGKSIRVFRQTGKKDRICRLPDGRLALMETKTTSEDISPESDFVGLTTISQQVSMYMSACEQAGKPVQTCIYDCIRKPSIKPTEVPILDEDGYKIVIDTNDERVYNPNGKPRQTASTADGYIIQKRPMTDSEWRTKLEAEIDADPQKYFRRFEVSRLNSELEEFAYELYEIAQDINTAAKTGRYYRNTTACRKWNSLCPYYCFCSGQANIDSLPEDFRVAEVEHEELV